MGVVSDGDCYGFPVGVVCSVPVRSESGQWEVVKGLTLTPDVQVCMASGAYEPLQLKGGS